MSFNGTSYSNATLDASYKQCIQKAGPYLNTDTYVYNGTNTLLGWSAVEIQTCKAFGAYIKASAMMVVAVVAATLF